MKIISYYATPKNAKALIDYINLFSVEADAAALGHVYWKEIISGDWVEYQTLLRDHNISATDTIVALTCAGMTWNLKAKQKAEAAERFFDIWIRGTQLKEEADVTK